MFYNYTALFNQMRFLREETDRKIEKVKQRYKDAAKFPRKKKKKIRKKCQSDYEFFMLMKKWDESILF